MNPEHATDLRRALAHQAERTPAAPPWTADLGRRVARRRRRGRSLIGVSVACLALLAYAAATITAAHRTGRATVTARPLNTGSAFAKSIRVHGVSIPYAGPVPWADAVATAPDPQTLTIFADGDRTRGIVCDLPTERVAVTETPTSVSVSVLGYQTPIPAGTGCAGVGHSPQPHQITLRAPLGHRRLLDTFDGSSHRVLDASAIPRPTLVPAGFVTQLIEWDEKQDFVTRSYSENVAKQRSLSIVLEYGVFSTCQCAVEHSAPNGRLAGTVGVGRVSAQLWRYTDSNNDITTLQWTPPGSKTIRLTVSGPPAQHLAVSEAVIIARSVQ